VEEDDRPERYQMEEVVDEEHPVLEVGDEALLAGELAGVEATQAVEVAEEDLHVLVEIAAEVELHPRHERVLAEPVEAKIVEPLDLGDGVAHVPVVVATGDEPKEECLPTLAEVDALQIVCVEDRL